MLSTVEQSQLLVTPAIVDTVNKAHIMPLALNAESSLAMSALLREHSKRIHFQHIWVTTGPAGCGQTTVCQYLQNELGVPFLEGDDYHSKSNKDKMGNGVPLIDEDRWDWFIAPRKAAIDALFPAESNDFHRPIAVVVSCSALKGKYRDVMRVAVYGSPYIKIHFIYLKLNEEMLMQRVIQREAHYMKSNIVRFQLQAPRGATERVGFHYYQCRGLPGAGATRRLLYSVCSNLKDGRDHGKVYWVEHTLV